MSDSTPQPPRGLAGDIHRARTGAKATAAELTEFMREFRGRSPQEMLGLVAASSLVQSTVVATMITLVLMAAFTVGPYLMSSPEPTAAAPAVATPPASAAPAAPAAPVAASSAAAPAAPVTAATSSVPAGLGLPPDPSAPASAEVMSKLGIGETKNADPKKNPLEAGGDDLLKDLK